MKFEDFSFDDLEPKRKRIEEVFFSAKCIFLQLGFNFISN